MKKKMKNKILVSFLAFVLVLTGICLVKPQVAEKAKASDTSEDITPNTPDKDMLSIKIQPRRNAGTDATIGTADDTMDLRLVSSVNGLGYENVGFEVYFTSVDGAKPETCDPIIFQTDAVLERINAAKTGVTYKYSPKVVDASSEYFVTGTLMGVVYKNWDNDFYVRAFCTKYGTDEKVYGAGRYFNVNEMLDSNTINITLPTATAPNADATTKAVTDTVTIGANATATSATLKYYDAENDYAYLSVKVPAGATVDSTTNKTSLKSASKVTVGSASTVYRNLESTYAKQGTDDSWYTVYDGLDSNETKFAIATSADLYGLAGLVNASAKTLGGDTIYLISDIVVNAVESSDDVANWTTNAPTYVWNSIGYDRAFAGTLDGQGHSISGLYMNGTADSYATDDGRQGLFYQARKCTIKNLQLLNSYMYNGKNYSGSIAGYFSGTMENVYSDAYIVNKPTSGENVGGLVGYVNLEVSSRVANCQYAGYMDTTDNVAGGMIGMCSGSASMMTMKDCLVTGTLNLSDGTGNRFGGIIGSFNATNATTPSTMTNCIFNGTQTGYAGSSSQKHGLLIGQIALSSGTLNLEKCYAYKNSSTMMGDPLGEGQTGTIICNDVSYTATTGNSGLNDLRKTTKLFNDALQMDNTIWCDTNEGVRLIEFVDDSERFDISWYSASTTEYSINDGWQLIGMSYLSNQNGNQFSGKTITLNDDIIVNTGDVSERALKGDDTLIVWTPIGLWKAFQGTFDGGNHSISGLYINDEEIDNCGTDFAGRRGLFYQATNCTIKNLKLTNSYIKGSAGYNASIAGYFSGTMEKVYSDADIVTGDTYYVGGLVGYVNADINCKLKECQYAGTMKVVDRNVGGIVGFVKSSTAGVNVTFEDCLVTGTLEVSDSASDTCFGGIAGSFQVTGTGADVNMTRCVFSGTLKDFIGTDVFSAGKYGLLLGQLYLASDDEVFDVDGCYAFKSEQTVCDDFIGDATCRGSVRDVVNDLTWTGAGTIDNINNKGYIKTSITDLTVNGCNLASTVWEDSTKGPIITIFK